MLSQSLSSALCSPEAWLIVLPALGLIGAGLAALGYWARHAHAQPAVALEQQRIEAARLKLDVQADAILALIQSHLDLASGYSSSLDEAERGLSSLTSPEQLKVLVKFLMSENERTQREASDLKTSLELSKSQIEKLHCNLAEAQEMGMRDPLTSISNRRYFDKTLAREITDAHAQGSALCLIMSDIDNFKRVNDEHGHLIGDEILKVFASVLADNVRSRDTVARYGGEEFSTILQQTDLAGAQRMTERMRAQFEAKKLAINQSGQPIGTITASFGIAQLAEGDTAEDLIRRADAKLYEAKCGGRNRIAVDRMTA